MNNEEKTQKTERVGEIYEPSSLLCFDMICVLTLPIYKN